ncbi:hypothetical protein DXA98_09955 [Lachnospiraceae bacterium OF09-6]|nr:hypothetical protein DXA98_09955 [Lachnospiraceae bacterium OF09-6]
MILAYLYGKNSLKDKTGEKMLTDERLYERYFLGEKEAAEQLVKRYGDSLIRYISGYISDYHESEDLMIEAFARCLRKNDRLQRTIALKPTFIKHREIWRCVIIRKRDFHYWNCIRQDLRCPES